MKPIVAVQLYTLRDFCDKDFDGVLERVAEIGFRAVEFGGFHNRKPADLRRTLDRCALEAVSAHIGLDRLSGDVEGVVRDAQALGLQYVVCPGIFEEKQRSANGYRAAAKTLESAGRRLVRDGLQIGYHNHDFEFMECGGKTGFQWLMDETDPEVVKFEVDTYWVDEGGEDPAAFIRRLGRRCPMIHLKDRARDGTFGEVGSGTLDFSAIFKAAESAGTGVYVVEQDTCPRDPFDCIATSLKFLQGRGIA
jgi:sugar phosphate isomerase/epimerase